MQKPRPRTHSAQSAGPSRRTPWHARPARRLPYVTGRSACGGTAQSAADIGPRTGPRQPPDGSIKPHPWGGWDSNPRPADYESSLPAHAILGPELGKCAGSGSYAARFRHTFDMIKRSKVVEPAAEAAGDLQVKRMGLYLRVPADTSGTEIVSRGGRVALAGMARVATEPRRSCRVSQGC
jgi:hypothetical protein